MKEGTAGKENMCLLCPLCDVLLGLIYVVFVVVLCVCALAISFRACVLCGGLLRAASVVAPGLAAFKSCYAA